MPTKVLDPNHDSQRLIPQNKTQKTEEEITSTPKKKKILPNLSSFSLFSSCRGKRKGERLINDNESNQIFSFENPMYKK